MKHLGAIVLLILAAVVLTTVPVAAQIELNPNQQPMYYTLTHATAKTYTLGQVDTFPSPSATNYSLYVGGSNRISATMIARDSISCTATFQYRVRGGVTWTSVAADSLAGTIDTLNVKEFNLRDHTTEKLVGLDIEVRVILTINAWKRGTTTPTYAFRWNYVPS